MSKIKYFMQQSWLLIVASFFFGLLIAVTSAGLSPRIIQNEINKRNRLVSLLLPEAKNFIPLDERRDASDRQVPQEDPGRRQTKNIATKTQSHKEEWNMKRH